MICGDNLEYSRTKYAHHPLISRALYPNDLEWALDNSRREFLVRAAVDADHPTIADDRMEAERIGMEMMGRPFKPCEMIAIIRLRDGKKWLFTGRSVRFPGTFHWPQGWRNTDEYARQRLAVHEANEARWASGWRS